MRLHITMGRKGGIGKSFCSIQLADYLARHRHAVHCVDLDPLTDNFHNVSALNVKKFDVFDDARVIDESRFDDMLSHVLASGADEAVIDTGGATYSSFSEHLSNGQVLQLLASEGAPSFIHTVVCGGPLMGLSIDGFLELADLFPEGPFVLWLNPVNGSLTTNGQHILENDVFKTRKRLVKAVVELPVLRKNTYSADLSNMVARGQTYAEAAKDTRLDIFKRQRLNQCRQAFDELLDDLFIQLEESSATDAQPENSHDPSREIDAHV